MIESEKYEHWPLPAGLAALDINVHAREMLHIGLEGRRVERLITDSPTSYILKQLSTDTVFTGESWAYARVLPYLPSMYPRLIAHSEGDHQEDIPWLLFEDVGTLEHNADEAMLLQVTEWMAIWHAVPLASYPELTSYGQKPGLASILSNLMSKKSISMDLLRALGSVEKSIDYFFHLLESHGFSQAVVYSHGDLHPGNFGRTSSGRIVVMDWEHNHRSTPMWDLYHLLDMPHPLFPRKTDPQTREKVLDTYLELTRSNGTIYDKTAFKREYMLFAAAFSLWMLHLIEGDLQDSDSIWPHDKLIRQREETRQTILGIFGILR
ncbi:phosphotransferase family protein [Paenibacillus provencensis]|uniref:Phosphotransferase family protein n=1 Tax=Paenibacillus provencensis TaxID=441151 RepID=A0ABW3PMI6_9BACL|nr:phosphotransferase [Paenibacillus sp. MER 78]MCM3126856.1 aminoglycoside phosphotransferase family protein [Paenibacillus sp. MER 78]